MNNTAWSAHFKHLALLLPLCVAGAGVAQADTLALRLLQTTDVHMSLLNWDYYQDKATDEYGLAKTATLIKAARAEQVNTLLFDNGDMNQGSPLGDYVARIKPLQGADVHPSVKVLNHLRYDAANIGNHEFNYGLPFALRAMQGAQYPYVNANVFVDDGGPRDRAKNAFTPYVILERHVLAASGARVPLKIGVMGLVPPQIMQWDEQHLKGKLFPRDMPETARRIVPEMKARGAQVIVVIAHTGFEFGETVHFAENTVARLAEVPGVNAVLFGHSHGEFPGRFFAKHPKVNLERGTINGVPAVMPGFWGSHLGLVDLTLNNDSGEWKVVDARAELRPVFDRNTRKPLVDADPSIAPLIAAEHAGTLATMRAEVARTSVPIHSYFAQVADDPSVQLVAQAQIAYAQRALAGTPHAGLPVLSAAAPFKTGGRQGWTYYTDIAAGPLALRNVADLYVYPNTLQAVRINGAQVREWLEMSASAFKHVQPEGATEQDFINDSFPSYNFDTIDGVNYTIDLTQPPRYQRGGKLINPSSRRIGNLLFEGKPMDEAALFVVVTNNYRASGGGDFPGLDGSNIVLRAPDENREALVQYLRDAKTVNPSADNNWRILPVPGVKLRFSSGIGAIAHLERYPHIKWIKNNGDGSALFELTP